MNAVRYPKLIRAGGTVLLEALLAVMILAVALTGMIQAMMSSLRASVAAVEYQRAAGLLDRVMIEQLLVPPDGPAPGVSSSFSSPFDAYRFNVKTADGEEIPGSGLRLRRIDGAVDWSAGRNTRRLSAAVMLPEEIERDEEPETP